MQPDVTVMPPPAVVRGWRPGWCFGGLMAIGLAFVAPQVALALPFDPVPSAFERWLNSRRDWPNGQALRFERLAQCSDQTAGGSPYRMPVFTCLEGRVAISATGGKPRVCSLQRVSYFPSQKRVRYWTESCR